MRRKLVFGAFFAFFLLGPSGDSNGWPVPDTGQTKCYDDAGNEIDPCPQPGEPFYGQDGNFLIDPPSYTKLGENGEELGDDADEWIMVRDNVTGLIWEVKQNKDGIQDYGNPHDADNTYTWYDSDSANNLGNPGTAGDGTDTEDFVGALNALGFGGFTDWRLPKHKEMLSLLDYSIPKPGPRINLDFFPNTFPSYFWSSNSGRRDPNVARYNYFFFGGDHDDFKSVRWHVRAVRGDEFQASANLVDNGNGTVTDTNTGLMWEQKLDNGTLQDKDQSFSWSEALDYSRNLSYAGYSDWRLPTINEIVSIFDSNRYLPAVDQKYFPGTQSSVHFSFYWSSSSHSNDPNLAHRVSFDFGYDGWGSKLYRWYVRAVRAGQIRKTDNLFITSPTRASSWNSQSALPIAWNTADIPGNVAISISYEGGKPGTFRSISSSTPNDGEYQWTIPAEVSSFNCMLKIEPLSDPSKGTTQGLFTIGDFILSSSSGQVLDEPTTPDAAPVSKIFRVILSGNPSGEVELDIATSNPGEFSVSPSRANLNSGNWNDGVEITLTPEYDGIPDGDQTSAVLVSTVDPNGPFQSVDLPVCSVTVRDSNADPTLISVYPGLGEANQPLEVRLKGFKFSDSTRVFLYPEGGVPAEVLTVNFIDETTLAAALPARSAGDYHLKADDSELRNAVTFAPAEIVEAQARKHAILVAGGGPYYENGLWLATKKCLRNAYRTLTFRGYGAEQIQLLTLDVGTDFTGDGRSEKDGDASLAALESAIAELDGTNADELLLYLVGPGSEAGFQFGSDDAPEYLTPAVLDGWLDDLQSRISGRVVVMLDACQAGSFLPGLKPPAGKERIVIAGSASWEPAWFLDDGELSFSHRLFDRLRDAPELFAAFRGARDDVSVFQTALIEVSGDAAADFRRRRDGETVAVGVKDAAEPPAPPWIEFLEANPPVLDAPETYESTLTAGGVEIPAGLDRIWCRIVLPIDVLRSAENPVLAAPSVKLFETGEAGAYGNEYAGFFWNGDYRALAHATDRDGVKTLFPREAVVTQTEGIPLDIDPGDVNVDTYVDIADAIRALQAAAGKHPHAIKYADADGDGRIGVGDAVFILQKVGRVRP